MGLDELFAKYGIIISFVLLIIFFGFFHLLILVGSLILYPFKRYMKSHNFELLIAIIVLVIIFTLGLYSAWSLLTEI